MFILYMSPLLSDPPVLSPSHLVLVHQDDHNHQLKASLWDLSYEWCQGGYVHLSELKCEPLKLPPKNSDIHDVRHWMKAIISHLFSVPCSCILLKLEIEQQGFLCGSPVVLEDIRWRNTSIIIRTFLAVLTVTPISTCLLEYPQAKDPVKCQGKK